MATAFGRFGAPAGNTLSGHGPMLDPLQSGGPGRFGRENGLNTVFSGLEEPDDCEVTALIKEHTGDETSPDHR